MGIELKHKLEMHAATSKFNYFPVNQGAGVSKHEVSTSAVRILNLGKQIFP